MNTATANKNYTLDLLAHHFVSEDFDSLENDLKAAQISDEEFLENVEFWIRLDEFQLERLKVAFVKYQNDKQDIHKVSDLEMVRLQQITKLLSATYKTQAEKNQIENTFFDLQIRRDNDDDSKRFRELFEKVKAAFQFDLFKRG